MTSDNFRTVKVGPKTTATAHKLLHYEGACNNVHGHNFEWNVELVVEMDDADATNMPLDFKEIDDQIDIVDHATLLNQADPLVGHESLLGDILVFDGDPTCELVSQWMADKLLEEHEPVVDVTVELAETDKYAIATTSYDTYGEEFEQEE